MEVLIIKFFILNALFTYVMSVGRQEGFGIKYYGKLKDNQNEFLAIVMLSKRYVSSFVLLNCMDGHIRGL
jgi:hypothetical protein